MDLPRQAEMIANRVKKTFKRLHGLMEQQAIGAFRLYDRDIPEIRAVVDWYEGHLVVGEYTRTQTDAVPEWLETIASAVAEALLVPASQVHTRRRRTRPAAGDRYNRLDARGERLTVRERDLRFLVNLDDYLDTGLFNDHRETRARVRAESAGKSVLNLFGYTGGFSVAAAKGGARSTLTVDSSSTYLDWAKDNLALNGLSGETTRADAFEFLERERRRFQLCILDPPSFSDRFDVQRDHPELIGRALALLEPGGVLWFSTNHQRFEARLPPGAVELTAQTVPLDYRNRQVHRCFRILT